MITADIHAELIAAFLGDDEPRYGERRCVSCLGPRRGWGRVNEPSVKVLRPQAPVSVRPGRSAHPELRSTR